MVRPVARREERTMTGPVLPAAIKQLINERIDSIPELETILLLRREREQTWSAEDAGARLYVSPTIAAHMLGTLTQRGFFSREHGRYRYSPESPELEATVTLLAETYSKHLIAVTNIVHAKPSAGVRLFANAFRWRKDK
jgi:hypothetical protein